jgi:quercetin dioxygenase-like cupin family protein
MACCHAVIQNLGKDLKGTLEPFVVTLHKDANSGGRNIMHSGMEFAYCLRGQVLYLLRDIEYLLTPGDSIVFSAQIPHRWENMQDGDTQFVLVISPTESAEEQNHFHFQEAG